MTLDLDPTDRAILIDLIQGALSDLSVEIASTDALEYRNALKRRRTALERALAAMMSAAA